MIKSGDPNIRMLIQVARRLGDLRGRVVFVGGSATGLFITDPAMPEVRVTKDVDVIVEISSKLEYYKLEKELQDRGFQKDLDESSPICRWLIEGIKVDVMPTQEDILGFSNRWYLPAITNADQIELEEELTIRLVTLPFFLATKFEAFNGRGQGDYLASHDLEDIIIAVQNSLETGGTPLRLLAIWTRIKGFKNQVYHFLLSKLNQLKLISLLFIRNWWNFKRFIYPSP